MILPLSGYQIVGTIPERPGIEVSWESIGMNDAQSSLILPPLGYPSGVIQCVTSNHKTSVIIKKSHKKVHNFIC